MEYTIKKRTNDATSSNNVSCCYSFQTHNIKSKNNICRINSVGKQHKRSSKTTISILKKILENIFGFYHFYITFITVISSASASDIQNSTTSETKSGCPSNTDPNCLKCNIDGCVKCSTLLIIDSRECTDQCPSGYLEQWSSYPDIMGKICISPSSNANNTTLAAIAGVLLGFLLCLVFLIVSAVVIKRKKRRKHLKNILIGENHNQNNHHNHHHHHHQRSIMIDRCDFLQQLNELRPDAEYILAMLNDTRRQIRKLHFSGETQAANSYRPMISDLAKLLILLNRPTELIPAPPHDWNRLYAWAESALQQYKPQYGQLIEFFQGNNDTSMDPRFHTLDKNSTFHGGVGGNGSTSYLKHSHQMQLFGSLISLHEFDESTRCTDPFGSSFNTLKNNSCGISGNGDDAVDSNLIMTNAELNASSLWLEDEFFKLGLRPQDEITTEL